MGEPTVQQYKNPLKWGWYYVERNGNAVSDLMSKRAAKAMRRDQTGKAGYGLAITYHAHAPKFKWFRRVGWPLKLQAEEKIAEA